MTRYRSTHTSAKGNLALDCSSKWWRSVWCGYFNQDATCVVSDGGRELFWWRRISSLWHRSLHSDGHSQFVTWTADSEARDQSDWRKGTYSHSPFHSAVPTVSLTLTSVYLCYCVSLLVGRLVDVLINWLVDWLTSLLVSLFLSILPLSHCFDISDTNQRASPAVLFMGWVKWNSS